MYAIVYPVYPFTFACINIMVTAVIYVTFN